MRRLLILSATALLLGTASMGTAGAGVDTSGPYPTTVSITVSLDLPRANDSQGPVVFQVTDVPVVAGPELTGADLVSNPSHWCGSLTVDVDNVAHTITITTDDPCDFQTAEVVVEGEGVDNLEVISDNLWLTSTGPVPGAVQGATIQGELPVSCEMARTQSAANGTATIDWDTGLDCAVDMNPEGAAVFSYAADQPTTTTTEAPTTTTTTQAVAAVAVTPRFTG